MSVPQSSFFRPHTNTRIGRSAQGYARFYFHRLGLLCNCGSLHWVRSQSLPKGETMGVSFCLCTIVCCRQLQPLLQEVLCCGVSGISFLTVVIPLPQPCVSQDKAWCRALRALVCCDAYATAGEVVVWMFQDWNFDQAGCKQTLFDRHPAGASASQICSFNEQIRRAHARGRQLLVVCPRVHPGGAEGAPDRSARDALERGLNACVAALLWLVAFKFSVS